MLLVDPFVTGETVGEFNQSLGTSSHFTYGLGLVSQTVLGSSLFYDFDALGSTAGLTNQGGSYVDQYSYDPFGTSLTRTETAANPFQYAGQFGVQVAPDDSLYMHARYESIDTGRFDSPDPIAAITPGANHYAYAGNDPVVGIDPTGLWTVSFSRQVSGGAIAGGTYQESYVWDGSSLLPEKQATFGAGLEAGAGLSGTIGLNFTDAPDAAFLTGHGYAFGLTGGEGVVGGFDYMAGDTVNPDGTVVGYSGFGLNLGLGLGTPLEVHLFGTDTAPLGPATPGELLTPAKPFFWDALDYFNRKPYKNPVTPVPPHPTIGTLAVTSQDPNSLTGPAGFGSPGFVAAGTALPYRIDFENSTSATAPAQRVTITDQLSPDLDWSTFELTGAGFGGTILNIPDNSSSYQTTVSMTETARRSMWRSRSDWTWPRAC